MAHLEELEVGRSLVEGVELHPLEILRQLEGQDRVPASTPRIVRTGIVVRPAFRPEDPQPSTR